MQTKEFATPSPITAAGQRMIDAPTDRELVGWQWRFKDGVWSKWINIEGDLDDFKRCQKRGLAKGSVEIRAIYATPSPTAAERTECGCTDECLHKPDCVFEKRMAEIMVTSRSVFDILNPVAAAVENLACHQEQCDMDGVMVKVSRQALDEVLEAVNRLVMAAAQDAISARVGK